MNRPENLSVYDELDLKLGIKSSLPHVKGTIALAILLWECADRPAELIYSQQNGDSIVLTDELDQWLVDDLSEICEEEQIGFEALMAGINENQLFKSQMEALIVPKKLLYTVNADIIHSLIDSNYDAYIRVLLSWIGFNINADPECEQHMLHLLTALSEEAVFKLTDGNRDVIFNQDSVYTKLLETEDAVDINGDSEAKGSLRVLKSLLSDSMNPYLSYSRGNVSVAREKRSSLEAYQKRVDMFLRLSATKVIGLEDIDAEDEGFSPEKYEENRITTGCNILLYGVPGSGKSWTIEHEYCKPESVVERLVFHPDYTYSDFIGQILPAVAEDGQVSYKFTPGPFTNILREAYNNPGKEYILIIEEINRGNAPAIFGEVFQLLDRKVEIRDIDDDGYPIGTSEYGITNMNIAEEMYGKDRKTEKVRIPSNLSIIGTMNTSDQNVFTLDTAFQRRWDMRLIENNFANVDPTLADAEILDTTVTWRNFCVEINKIVVGNSARMTSAEDKRLGAYFVHLRDLKFNDAMGDLKVYDALRKKESKGTLTDDEKTQIAIIRDAIRQNRKFPEKVIKYLWDDAFKFNREVIFEVTEYQSLEQVIRAFMYAQGLDRFKVFKDNVKDAFTGEDEE